VVQWKTGWQRVFVLESHEFPDVGQDEIEWSSHGTIHPLNEKNVTHHGLRVLLDAVQLVLHVLYPFQDFLHGLVRL